MLTEHSSYCCNLSTLFMLLLNMLMESATYIMAKTTIPRQATLDGLVHKTCKEVNDSLHFFFQFWNVTIVLHLDQGQ